MSDTYDVLVIGAGPAGITPSIVQLLPDEPTDVVVEYAGVLLDAPERPTAVLCYSDVLARGVLDAARDRRLRIPEDLSVAGFDDAPLATRTVPPLTTVRQNSDAKGRAAAALLAARIEAARNGSEPPAEHVVLPTELVVRRSTAPPPA